MKAPSTWMTYHVPFPSDKPFQTGVGVISQWNRLPYKVVLYSSLEVFKEEPDRHLSELP